MRARRKIGPVSDPNPPPPAESPPSSAIHRQLKNVWHRLNPDIRARFSRDPEPGEAIVYEGVMYEIRRSRAGWLFAQITRLIGNPLTPYAGRDVPMEVTPYKKTGTESVFWRRIYYYPRRKPYIVTSVKRESVRGEMMECVGFGFGMLLDLSIRDGQLHFESTRYFWQAASIRVALPHWLSPGKTHVIHEDLGDGDFRFTISMDHNQLGNTFFQQGTFHEKTRVR